VVNKKQKRVPAGMVLQGAGGVVEHDKTGLPNEGLIMVMTNVT
jgi:hypothetical protein